MTDVNHSITCLILAAGFSRRFGQDKLQYRLPDGLTMLAQTVSLYEQLGIPVCVVTQAGKKHGLGLTPATRYPHTSVCEHGAAAQGLSQSIVAGVTDTQPEIGWLIALADMPYINIKTLRTLVARAHPSNVVLPLYHGDVGNPVFIGSEYQRALMSLTGDQGAKTFIASLADQYVDKVPVDDPGVLLDIDVPGDIMRQYCSSTL